MGIGANLGALLIGISVVSINVAAACYFVVPWGRIVNAEEAPEGVPVVRLTRLGTTVGFLSVVPAMAGGWFTYAEIAAMVPRDAELTLLQRVATVVPGEALLVVSLFGGMLATFAPVWVSLWVRVRRSVAARTGR